MFGALSKPRGRRTGDDNASDNPGNKTKNDYSARKFGDVTAYW